MSKSRWLVLALLVVAAIILVVALLRSCGPAAPASEQSALSDSAEIDDSAAFASGGIDPATGLELEEDELPIVTT